MLLQFQREVARLGVAVGGRFDKVQRWMTSFGSTLPMPVIAPVAPQLTKPWKTAVSTPTISATSSSGAGDVLGGVAAGSRAAELLEADEVRMLVAQREEQIGSGLEAVIGAVVDDRGQIGRGRKDRLEMARAGPPSRTARQHARDHHQPLRADLLGMGGMRHGRRRVDARPCRR